MLKELDDSNERLKAFEARLTLDFQSYQGQNVVQMGSACKEIRDDTEKQLHAICSMVEDIAKIAS